MTRAKQSLLISRAIYRRTYGEDRLRASMPSRFVAEIPGDLIEAAAGSYSEPGETRRYEPDPEFSEGYASRQRPRSLRTEALPITAALRQPRRDRSPSSGRAAAAPGPRRRSETSTCWHRACAIPNMAWAPSSKLTAKARRPPLHRELPGLRPQKAHRTLRQPAIGLTPLRPAISIRRSSPV